MKSNFEISHEPTLGTTAKMSTEAARLEKIHLPHFWVFVLDLTLFVIAHISRTFIQILQSKAPRPEFFSF